MKGSQLKWVLDKVKIGPKQGFCYNCKINCSRTLIWGLAVHINFKLQA